MAHYAVLRGMDAVDPEKLNGLAAQGYRVVGSPVSHNNALYVILERETHPSFTYNDKGEKVWGNVTTPIVIGDIVALTGDGFERAERNQEPQARLRPYVTPE